MIDEAWLDEIALDKDHSNEFFGFKVRAQWGEIMELIALARWAKQHAIPALEDTSIRERTLGRQALLGRHSAQGALIALPKEEK